MSRRNRRDQAGAGHGSELDVDRAITPRSTRRGTRLVVVALVVTSLAVGLGWYLRHRPITASNSEAAPEWRLPELDASQLTPPVARAIQAARKAVSDRPDSAESWGALGMVLDAHEEWAAAETCYRRALQLSPGDFRWVYYLAVVEDSRNSELADVVPAFEAAIALRPNSSAVLIRYALALTRRARLAEAREAYEKALRLDEANAAGQLRYGQLLLTLGESENALRHLQRAAQLAPGDGTVDGSLAQAYTSIGELEKAAAATRAAAAKRRDTRFYDPDRHAVELLSMSPKACQARALQLSQDGEFAKAIPDLKRFLESYPQDATAYFLLAVAYRETGQPGMALKNAEKAVSLDDALPEAHGELARQLAELGEHDRADTHYRRALELKPDDWSLHARYGLLLAMRGILPGALAEFERSAELEPPGTELHHNWGVTLTLAGDLPRAVTHFRAAIAQDPRHVPSLLRLGAALEQLGQRSEAIDQYRQALSLDPGSGAAARLAALTGATP